MTIIFDLDGTLLYTLEDLRDALNHTLKQFGYNEVSLDTTKKLVGNGIKNLILDAYHDKQHIDLMFEEFKRYYEIHCIDKTLPYVGMVKLIYSLKNDGHTLVCISNKHYITLTKLIEYFFPNQFDLILGDGMGYPKKPNPNIIYACMEKLNKKSDDLVYIGDSDVDANTIINASIKGILVSYGYRDKGLLLKFGLPIVDNVSELEEMINRIK